MDEQQTPDKWMTDFKSVDHRRLHAIGAIVYEWNRCEGEMFSVLCVLSKTRPKLLKILTATSNNVEIAEKVKTLSRSSTLTVEAKDFCLHICRVFDINRTNRNTIVHAWPWSCDESGQATFMIQKKHHLATRPFKGSLDELRRTADEITLCWSRLHRFDLFLRSPQVSSLPEKPPLPDILLSPPPQATPKPFPRPGSSHQ